MGIEVSVINDSHRAGWVWAATHSGELPLRNVAQMVDAVLNHVRTFMPPPGPNDALIYAMSHGRVPMPARPTPGSARLSRLNIMDHGDPTGGDFGSDAVDVSNFANFDAQFRRLRPWFDQGGFVHLQHCEIGQNVGLLQMFADAFGVPVVGGRGKDNPAYRTNFGYYVRVYPVVAGTRRSHDAFFWRP